MSELAERERIVRQRWALPGGAHDRLINLLKIGLPALIGVVLAFLAFSPLEEKQEVSFLLDKNKAGHAEERLRVQSAQYRGQDDRGRPFVLTARQAVQPNADEQIVLIRDMQAQIMLERGPAQLQALRARYDMDTDRVDVIGPIRFTASDGYQLDTRDVVVDLRRRQLASRGSVEGRMPLGRFTAGRMEASLPDRRVVLSDRAQVHIVQGAVQ